MSTPTINVNLAPCRCGGTHPAWGLPPHTSWCTAAPVLIPCPIPRSVTLHVVLGECDSGCSTTRPGQSHYVHCKARPIRVSCSIYGKTWEESEVADVEQHGVEDFRHESARQIVISTCRELWALVKALVLGFPTRNMALYWDVADRALALVDQRDAVYAALVEIARAEEALSERANAILKTCARSERIPSRGDDDVSPSANLLSVYVRRLLEQVVDVGVSP